MKVFSNTAISLDGRINTRERGSASLGSKRDRARMRLLRGQADAVLVGGATFRNWPRPSLPDEKELAARSAPFWNVVVSRTLRVELSPDYIAERRMRPLFLTLAGSVPANFHAEVESYAGEGADIPVPWILDALRRRGVERLLVEAGGDLLFQFLAANALDEIHVTLCPLVIGGPAPSLADGPGFLLTDARRLRLLESEVIGDEIFLRYAADR